ncbi:MAG TPA: PspC domain-containing protein [Sphingomicrobium sp.]|nr:PspC domain-containing protein [Sphingomicrobium sp.]
MQTANEQALNSNPDSLFGVCQAIGEDFGFNPFFLRLGFLGLGFFSIPATVSAYALLGIGVAASRWLFPAKPKSQEIGSEQMQPNAAYGAEDAELLAA